MDDKKLKYLKDIFVFFLTIIILIFLFSKIDFFELINTFKQVNLILLLFAVFISFFNNIFLNADMWKRILKCLGCNISLKEAVFIRMASYPLKVLLPVKSGEFFRVVYLKKQKNFSLKKGSTSIIFDIILNVCALLSLIFASIIFLKINLFNIPFIVITGLIFSFIVFFCLKATQNFTFSIVKKIHFKFYNTLRILFAFEGIKSRKQSYFILYAFIIQLIALANYYILSKAINLNIPFSKIILFFPLIVIISLVPITISGLGVREGLVILFFLEFASFQSLLGLGILISFVEYILPALIGLFFVKPFLSKMLYPKKL